MDIIQDWAAHFLGSHETLRTYSPYARQAYTYISTLKSHLLPLIDQISRKPDLATIALLLIILFISLKVLNMLWQTVIFWFRLAKSLLFWGGLGVLGVWMYARGPEGVLEDVGYWWRVWNQEHDFYREKERIARLTRQGRGPGAAHGGWF